MVSTLCLSCGGLLHWDWTEAFAKFGFNDGDGQIETWQVEDILLAAGYEVTVDNWGPHNTLITSVKKDGAELLPFDNPDYRFGYDDPRLYFPGDLVALLDRELPPSGRIIKFSKGIGVLKINPQISSSQETPLIPLKKLSSPVSSPDN